MASINDLSDMLSFHDEMKKDLDNAWSEYQSSLMAFRTARLDLVRDMVNKGFEEFLIPDTARMRKATRRIR